jgi:hypothetical protein
VRVTKPIIKGGTGTRIVCCWFDCERDAYELHKVRHHYHHRAIPCDQAEDTAHPWAAFCSERHRQLYINSHRSMGNLPMGSRGTLL